MTQLFFHSLTLHPLCLWNCNSFFASSAVYFTLLLYCTLVHSRSYVSLLLPNSHCGFFIPHVPFSISISLSCAVSLLFIYVYQSFTLFLYLIFLSIYCFYSFLTSLSPEIALIMYCVLWYRTKIERLYQVWTSTSSYYLTYHCIMTMSCCLYNLALID